MAAYLAVLSFLTGLRTNILNKSFGNRFAKAFYTFKLDIIRTYSYNMKDYVRFGGLFMALALLIKIGSLFIIALGAYALVKFRVLQ